jgi:outer membrane protein TolC
MCLRRLLLGFFLSLSIVLPIFAASVNAAEGDHVLAWQDCVRLAKLRNPDLFSAQRTTEASRAQYRGSFNGILPKVSLSNSYSDSSSSGFGGSGSSESKLWDAHGTASLDLVDFGQWATIQSASASLRQSQANLEVASTSVLLSLYKSFSALLFAQEEVLVNNNIRDIWKMNAQMIDLRYKSGSESKGNNMNTQAQLLQAEVGLAQAGRDTRVAQQQLSQVLGMDEFQALSATGTWDVPPAPSPHPDLAAIMVKLPQIRAQQAVVEQAQAAIRIARSALWPTLSLSYSKGAQGDSEFPSNPYWAFTGTVNYPLFGGGLTSTYYARQAAERSYEKALQDLRSLRNQSRTTLENAWSAFAQAQDQIRVQRAFLEADKQRKAEYDVLYRSGLMSFQEWILVVEEYVNFQTSFLKSEQNLMLAEAQWRFASGQQLGE